jgi:hypothetical protein
MSAGTTAKLPPWEYGMLHLPDDVAYVKTADDALAHAFAVQRIALLMTHGMKAEDVAEDGDEELLEHVSLYGWLWTRRASELLAAERAAAQAQPPPQPEKVTSLMDGLKRQIVRRKARA